MLLKNSFVGLLVCWFVGILFISGPDPTPIGDRPQYKVFRRKGQVSIGGYLILLSSSEAEVSCILM